MYGEEDHPEAEWGTGLFTNYRYNRRVEAGGIIGQAFERTHLYDETNSYGAPEIPSTGGDLQHIPVSFMIDIPAG